MSRDDIWGTVRTNWLNWLKVVSLNCKLTGWMEISSCSIYLCWYRGIGTSPSLIKQPCQATAWGFLRPGFCCLYKTWERHRHTDTDTDTHTHTHTHTITYAKRERKKEPICWQLGDSPDFRMDNWYKYLSGCPCGKHPNDCGKWQTLSSTPWYFLS